MNKRADIGLVGLSVMGSNLALNIAAHGFAVAVYNRTREKTAAFTASEEAKGLPVIGCASPEDLVAAIRKPAPVILMIQAGPPVDEMTRKLLPLLEKGDIVVDAGNSFYKDTIRRERELREAGLHFMGVGVSGGEEGARNGPSVMPGGPVEAYRRVEPILTAISAKVDGAPCCAHVGPDGAGHYVKMVHNGIEYADMQLIAEAYDLLRIVGGLDYPALREVFAEWNRGELESYLVEITADILGRVDAETGRPLVELIKDQAGQKGTGRWTAVDALDLGVAAPTMIEAVQARSLSAVRDERAAASAILPGPGAAAAPGGDFVEMVRRALHASKLVCYAQGFQLLRAASTQYGWNLDFGELAMLWRGGCIIRARFLTRIRDAFKADPGLTNLLLDGYFREVARQAQTAWRETVALAAKAGVPAPAFGSALAYYDGYRAARLPANLIQAQRDYFGAHTYERVDRPGVFHTEWQ